VDDVTKIAVVSTMPSAALLAWSDAADRVPTKTLPVVPVITQVTVLLVVDRICYRCCVQHRLEPLDMRIDLFIALGEIG
jgi:predicted TIM-barrel enzyme